MICNYSKGMARPHQFEDPRTGRVEDWQVRQKSGGIMIAICAVCGRADVFTQKGHDASKWMRDAQQEMMDVPIKEDRT